MARKSLAAAVVCTLGATPAAFATDIYGVQLALNGGAPPQINAILIPGGATNPNYGDFGSFFGRLYNVPVYLDTGASGISLSRSTATYLTQNGQPNFDTTGLGEMTHPSNGQKVYFEDVGVTAQTVPRFSVSQPFTIKLANFNPVNNTVIEDGTTAFSQPNPPNFANVDLSIYKTTVTGVRAQIGPFLGNDPDEGATTDIDVMGMPVIKGKVMVMDTKPLDSAIFGKYEEGDTIKTYLYAPGTPHKPNTATTDPGILPTNRSIRLSRADFEPYTTMGTAPTPGGTLTPLSTADRKTYGPSLESNPFIGPNPLNPTGDTTPPVKISFGAKSTTGSFLLDTGAVFSAISTHLAENLNVRYRPGTQNTDSPQLEVFNPANPAATGTLIGDQFSLDIGGIDGSKKVSGFYLSSLLVKTIQGNAAIDNDPKHIRFMDAPVLVNDVTTTHSVTGQAITLDGIFGTNLLGASMNFEADASGFPILSALTPGAFDHVVFDEPNSLLSVKMRTPGDADRDGAVNLNDLIALANNYGSTTLTGEPWRAGDFNGDGVVDLNDLIILANHYGSSDLLDSDIIDLPHYDPPDIFGDTAAAVPEPGSAIMLTVAASITMLRRRRRIGQG